MSKVVFVGNVPYNMGEDQLTDIFRSVGQVVGFRLVFDRETGKPKGYGFCEFADHETAASAVRNLNNVDVGGRPLRIDLADSDPFLEGKTTVRGELVDGGEPGPNERGRGGGRQNEMDVFMASLPPGIKVPPGTSPMDTISHTLGTMNPTRLTEVLAQMKAFVITHPDHARKVLQTNPQLAYALFQALVLNNIVDPSILQRMREASGMSAPPAPPPSAQLPPPAVPATYPPPPMQQYPGYPPMPPAPMMYPPPGPNSYYRPPLAPGMGAPPPPPQQSQAQMPASLAGVSEEQRAVLLQVLNMTPDRINALPEGERAAIQQLRAQFGAA
ncbi:hypothetical protein BDZ89DRAFT_1160759 [Hymenopellis radicata]|nr:hypothetical protein BDZ89DRAFT_1160759 [Hymenopellis radicata]